jgi:phage repressor protein C with HTH and peptisase S24 domain
MLLSHERVWAAIDELAVRNGLSTSGLAKRAGLDSTAFNKSKRISADGRKRWPSTESVAKVIQATGATLEEFLSLISGEAIKAARRKFTVPLLGLAQAGAGGYFDDAGYPVGEGWELIELPVQPGEVAYALQVQGDSMLPVYRDRDVIIVEPGATVRKGDRVVVKTTTGEVMAKVLQKRNAREIELMSINPDHPLRTVPAGDVEWMARIIWASQ